MAFPKIATLAKMLDVLIPCPAELVWVGCGNTESSVVDYKHPSDLEKRNPLADYAIR